MTKNEDLKQEAKSDPTPQTSEDKQAAEAGGEVELEQLQGDLDRFRDLALRTQADFENFRKRAAREREEAVRYANASLLEKLIPILDNFELGLDAAKTDANAGAIMSGMEMVRRQLQDFMGAHGVEVIDAIGQPFDPHAHEALGQEESETVEEGHVVRQIRKGYKLKDRLIRPANVMVSRGKPAKA